MQIIGNWLHGAKWGLSFDFYRFSNMTVSEAYNFWPWKKHGFVVEDGQWVLDARTLTDCVVYDLDFMLKPIMFFTLIILTWIQ